MSEPLIRRYRPEDKPAIIRLYGDVRGAPMTADEIRLWEWQFEENPFHPPDGLLYWVMDDDGGLAGQMATMPFRLQLEGREFPSAWGVDLMVAPESRGRGLALRFLMTWTDRLQVTLGKGIADAAYHLATARLSWRDIGPTHRHVKLLNPQRALEGEFAHPVVGKMGGMAGAVFDRMLTRRRSGPSGSVEVRDPAVFGPDQNQLWERICGAFAMAPIRDEAYLTWRYARHPFHRYRAILSRDGNRLTGCVVIRSFTDRKERRVAQVLELLAHPDDEETLDALVAHTVRLLQGEDTDYMVAMVTDRGLSKRLARYGFLRRRAPETRLIGEFGRLTVSPSRVLSAENWLITLGDADTVVT